MSLQATPCVQCHQPLSSEAQLPAGFTHLYHEKCWKITYQGTLIKKRNTSLYPSETLHIQTLILSTGEKIIAVFNKISNETLKECGI